jgi:hypothetical protein
MSNGEDKGGKDTPNSKKPQEPAQRESQDGARNPAIQAIDAPNTAPATRTDELYVVPGLARNKSTKSQILENYSSHYQQLTDITAQDTRAIRKIAGWRDPFTPPQFKNDCVKYCSVTPWDKWCCGWALRKKWMDCELFVEVRTATPQDLITAIEECLQEAAVASAIAGIIAAVITGGAALEAAKATFVSVFTICIERKLSGVVSIQLPQSCGWSDWE